MEKHKPATPLPRRKKLPPNIGWTFIVKLQGFNQAGRCVWASKVDARSVKLYSNVPLLVESLKRLIESHARLEQERGSVVGTLTANARLILRELGEE